MKNLVILLILASLWMQASLALAAPIQVQVDQAIPHGFEKVGIGSMITLKIPGQTGAHAGLFLGKMMSPDGTLDQYMLADTDKKRVYLVRDQELEMPKTSLQPILRQYDQVGGTCTGYALDHLMQEMNLNGFIGNGVLKTTLSTEKGRTQLLVDAVNQYYLVTQHKFSINGILAGYGKQFGFKCAKKVFSANDAAIQYVESAIKLGPLLLSFNVGPNMVNSAFSIQDYESPSPLLDNRLWVPRKVGERASGGHSVIAVSEFEANGVKKLLMLDSDWSEPRIWDLNEYLGGKVAIAEMEFYNCQ